MRAIIINDSDATALLDQLKLESFETKHAVQHLGLLDKLTAGEREILVNALTSQIHGAFHFRVTRWLQEQGASCVRF